MSGGAGHGGRSRLPAAGDCGVIWCAAASVRTHIARAMLGSAHEPSSLGAIHLLPHQLSAVRRIRPVLAELGGVLLADAVGLGKTYVALAIARSAERPLIVAPATLRSTWEDALARTGISAGFVSMEALSRGWSASEPPDLVIVDEAHHFRTRTTQRHDALSRLCARARVLLLSATPVHNRRGDLEALLALFMGARARMIDQETLARVVIRRSEEDAGLAMPLPPLPPMMWLRHAGEHDLLDALVNLPPAVPPSDGGDAGVLAVWSLVRQWASSRAALVLALRRRVARAVAMEALLENGTMPGSRELAAWRFAEDAVQLALPGLLAGTGGAKSTCEALLQAVARHRMALEELLEQIARTADPDDERARHIQQVRAVHPASRIVAFSEYEATVAALFRRLAPGGNVAMLTSRGARVSGGELRRQEVLTRFAPRASGVPAARAAEDVTLLLTTELLSEGVNLQDADVVVHLDLPWNPARLEQRVGRVRRIGASRTVHVYALSPPAAAERLLAVTRRLRAKMRAAGAVVGLEGSMLPALLGGPVVLRGGSAAEHATRVRTLLERWNIERPGYSQEPHGASHHTIACAVAAPVGGFVAMVYDGGERLLVASTGATVSLEPEVVARALTLAGGDHVPPQPALLRAALHALSRWLATRRLHAVLHTSGAPLAQTRQRLLRKLAAVERALPRDARGSMTGLLERARAVALRPVGAQLERELAALAVSTSTGHQWLRELAAVGERGVEPRGQRTLADAASGECLEAIILLAPPRAHSSRLSSCSEAELMQ